MRNPRYGWTRKEGSHFPSFPAAKGLLRRTVLEDWKKVNFRETELQANNYTSISPYAPAPESWGVANRGMEAHHLFFQKI